MRLLLDVGNSRVKWALADVGGLIEHGVAEHGGDIASALPVVMRTDIDQIWVSQVVGGAQADALREGLHARWGLAPRFATVAAAWRGLRNAYAEPERLGVDRWLAMLAAWSEARAATVVVDAGTALTVDVIAADGRHLGGVIAAGLHAQWSAVSRNTRFGNRDPGFRVLDVRDRLGRNTEDCVRQGALLSCLGAIDRAAEAGGPQARRLITGGDASLLLPDLAPDWQHRPQLVLEGLDALAAEEAGKPGPG